MYFEVRVSGAGNTCCTAATDIEVLDPLWQPKVGIIRGEYSVASIRLNHLKAGDKDERRIIITLAECNC